MSRTRVAACLLAVTGLAGGNLPAGEHRTHVPHTHHRAGHPQRLAHHLVPTITPNYQGGYVGGGAAHGGHARRPSEGTWGYDYVGHPWIHRKVFLGWSHGRLYQGGGGTYATEGPKIIGPLLRHEHREH